MGHVTLGVSHWKGCGGGLTDESESKLGKKPNVAIKKKPRANRINAWGTRTAHNEGSKIRRKRSNGPHFRKVEKRTP